MRKKANTPEQLVAGMMKPPKKPKSKAECFEDDFDDVYRAYHDKSDRYKLSEAQERQLARWRWAREWVKSFPYDSTPDLVSAISTEFDITERQAYTDVANMKRFYASVTTENKEYERVMMVERLRKKMKQLEVLGTEKAFEASIRAEALIAKLLGMDTPEDKAPMPTLVHIEPDFNPALIGAVPIENLELKMRYWQKAKQEKELANVQDVDYELLLEKPYERGNRES